MNQTKMKKNKVGFNPRGENILVDLAESDRVFSKIEDPEGRQIEIIKPDTSVEESRHAIVVAVGKKVEEVEVGDRVVFEKHSGVPITIDDRKYLRLTESQIYGTVDEGVSVSTKH